MNRYLALLVLVSAIFSSLIFFLFAPVVVWGFSSLNTENLIIHEFRFQSKQKNPSLVALVERQNRLSETLRPNLTLTDELKDLKREIPLGEVKLPNEDLNEIELSWESPWTGWGLIKAELSLITDSGEKAQASTNFLYLPPEMATFSLASLLTLSGFVGRNLITRMILT